MSIKTILVPLPVSTDPAVEIGTALAAAKMLNAHVEALFIDEGASSTLSAGNAAMARHLGTDALAQQAKAREERTENARAEFMRACEAEGVEVRETGDAANGPSASWSEAHGPYESTVAARATAFDLVIASSAAVAAPLKDIAETSLLQTRRPVLLAPSRLKGDLAGSVMIGWDESVECWHAVSAALPFLEHAKHVDVVSVDKDRDAAERTASQERVVNYLGWHGIAATPKVVAPLTRPVGDALLSEAGDPRVGLLVMGAYSHGRMRERLFGGATRHVLMNAAATPVFMAH